MQETKMPFNRQKPRAEPDSVVGDHLPRPGGLIEVGDGRDERRGDTAAAAVITTLLIEID